MKKTIVVLFWLESGSVLPYLNEDGTLIQFDSHEEAAEALRGHTLEAWAETVAVRR